MSLLVPIGMSLKIQRYQSTTKISFGIIIGTKTMSILFLLPRMWLIYIDMIYNLLLFKDLLLVQNSCTGWSPPQLVHLVLNPFGVGHSLARCPWPLQLWHHTLCHSFVGWGLLGLLLATLSDSSNNCLVKFHMALSCLAITGSCCVFMLMVY